MAGNAHRSRARRRPCDANCLFCQARPQQKLYRNKNGHRHNPAANKKQTKRRQGLSDLLKRAR